MTWVPHNPDAEAGIIGVCLTAPSLVARLACDYEITASDFHTPLTRQMWETMLALDDRGDSIDTVTVAAALPSPQADQQVHEMLVAASATGAIKQHAQLLKMMSLRRRWHRAGSALTEAATTGEESLVAQAEKHLAAPSVSDDSTGPQEVGMAVVQFLGATGSVGTSTGFPALDARLGGGLRPGDCTALAAWTSMGKSVVANNVLSHASATGLRSHLYINEMSVTDVGLRQVATISGVQHSRLVVRTLTQD